MIAPWNIVAYNIFTNHGPDLYGTAPWFFYILNGILNFNVAFVIALLTPALLVSVLDRCKGSMYSNVTKGVLVIRRFGSK